MKKIERKKNVSDNKLEQMGVMEKNGRDLVSVHFYISFIGEFNLSGGIVRILGRTIGRLVDDNFERGGNFFVKKAYGD